MCRLAIVDEAVLRPELVRPGRDVGWSRGLGQQQTSPVYHALLTVCVVLHVFVDVICCRMVRGIASNARLPLGLPHSNVVDTESTGADDEPD